MLTNLFSMFDSTLHIFSPMYLMVFMFFMYFSLNSKKFMTKNMKNIMENMMMNVLNKEIKSEIKNTNYKKKNVKNMGLKKMLFYLFIMVLFLNYFSLFPFSMCTTAHIAFNIPLILNMWLMSITMGLLVSYKNFFAHLTPMGTPMALMSFMVLIETISNMIRPITLSVRLMANMVAGHLLLTLLSKFSMLSFSNHLVSSAIMLILGILETGVSFIQAYVLMLLCTLYVKEAFN